MTSLRGNRVTALGASQVAASGAGGTSLEGEGFFAWFVWAGQGRYRYHPIEAGGSEPLATTLNRISNYDNHISLYGAKPHWCIIQAGRNNAQGVDHAAKLALYEQILDKLQSRDIQPIITELIPCDDLSTEDNCIYYNVGLCQIAARRGIPFVRVPRSLYDEVSGGIPTAHILGGTDKLHLSTSGAKLFGEHVAAKLTTLGGPFIPWEPLLARSNDAETAKAYKLSNPVLLTDTNSDDIPDNWGLSTGADAGVTSWGLVDADPDDVAGNWWQITKTATTQDVVASASIAAPITPGNWLAVGYAFKFEYGSGSGNRIWIDVRDQAATYLVRDVYYADSDVDVVRQWRIVQIPAGSTSLSFRCIHTAVGTVSFGQPTVIDLTAAGIDNWK